MSQSDFVTRGQALVSSGQYQEAVKVCRLGLLGRPTTVEGRVVLGQALLALKRYDEVLAEMRVALELDHASHAAQVLKGEALLRKGDGHGAAEVLGKLRSQGLADSHVAELLAEAERLASRSPPGSAGPSLGYPAGDPGEFAVDQGTKNYPAQVEEREADGVDGGGEFTRPTSLAAPGARRRSSPEPAAPPPAATPPPDVLAVGDRSGTVEVDRERDSTGLRGGRDDDLGDTVGPPVPDRAGRRSGPPGGAPSWAAVSPPADEFDDLDAAATSVLSHSERGAGDRSAMALPEAPSGPRYGAAGTPSERSSKSSSRSPAPAPAAAAKKSRRASMLKEEVSTVELGDDEVIELEDRRSPAPRAAEPERATSRRPPGPGTAVRDAVKLPSGPLDLPVEPRPTGPAISAPVPAPPPAPHLAQLIANQPHVMNMVPSQPLPPPAALNPRSAIAAALPTAAALPMPSPPGPSPAMAPPRPAMGYAVPAPGPQAVPMALAATMPAGLPAAPPGMPAPAPPPHLAQTMLAQPNPFAPPAASAAALAASAAAAARPTIAINPHGQPAPAVDPAFGAAFGPAAGGPGQAWGRGPMPYAVEDAGRAAGPGMHIQQGSGGVPMIGLGGDSSSVSKSARTGRRGRPRLIVLWLLISATVISAGVFAGLQIRVVRLHRQIAAARDRAAELARPDTWQGWIAARDGFSGIAAASPTPDNKAAAARARGVLAFEFGDSLADARTAIDGITGQAGGQAGSQAGAELPLAQAYVALAQRDAKGAQGAAASALQAAPNDAAALYVSGQAALLAGDLKEALAALRSAVEREARPHYLIGLARALGEAAAWDDALAALDRARDNPGAMIARAALLARAGRATGTAVTEIRAQLGKLIGDGKPSDSVSPLQVTLAQLALARVDHARGDHAAAQADYRAALNQKLDDNLQFAEELGDTVLAIGDVEFAQKVATRTLKEWPVSRRARLALAQIALAQGRPAAAVEVFTRSPELAAGPVGQTLRGQARFAAGEVDGARADFDAAVKRLPGYEPALIAQTWIDLAAGDVDGALHRIEPRFNPKTSTAGIAAAYAAVLRATGQPQALEKARALLERAAAGSISPDTARARLELARVDRDLGDFAAARTAYGEAARAGNFDARIESSTLLIDNRDPRGGHDALEELLRESGDQAPAALLLEAARARTLVGDHKGAFDALVRADKAPGVVRWQLDRERGRLALKKGDYAGAAQALSRALDRCGGDLDSFLLAADTVSADDKHAELAGKLKAQLPARLKGKPEIDIIRGKLEIAANRFDEAEQHYAAAHEALGRDKVSPRRLAQCDFGLGVAAYFNRQDASATSRLKLVVAEDPSIDAAYLFAADLERGRDPDKALDLARQAVAYNPDSVEAWKMVGTIAAQLPRQRKLLDEAISHVNDLAPGSEQLRALQKLKQGS